MLSTIGRAAVRRVVAAGPQSTNRAYHLHQFQRAALSIIGNDGGLLRSNVLFMYRRAYATTTEAASKPKSKSSGTTKAKAAAKPRAKKASTKAKRPTKAAAKKPKKTVAKPKKKPAKKELTPLAKKRAEIRALKVQALVVPKPKAPTAWRLYIEENFKEGTPPGESAFSALAKEFKSAGPEELESLNHTVNQNKIENKIALEKWVETHSPDEIRLANNARLMLKRKYNLRGFRPIPDSRIPKQPSNARSYFVKGRYATGDMKGISFADASKLIAQEWRALSASERKVYEDLAAIDQDRYSQEHKTVYHRDPLKDLRRP